MSQEQLDQQTDAALAEARAMWAAMGLRGSSAHSASAAIRSGCSSSKEAMKQERLLINNPCEITQSDARRLYEAAL